MTLTSCKITVTIKKKCCFFLFFLFFFLLDLSGHPGCCPPHCKLPLKTFGNPWKGAVGAGCGSEGAGCGSGAPVELLQTQGGHKARSLIHQLINAANYSGLMLPPWANVMHVGTRDAKKMG